jgi:hypothetical protein
MLIIEVVETVTVRGSVADSTTSDGHGLSLILQRLIIIIGFAAGKHGVGAPVACRAINITMSGGVPIQNRTGVDF